MKFDNINQLAAYASEAYSTNYPTLESLAALLAAIVSAPVAKVQFLRPNGAEIPLERTVSNVLTGDSGSYIRITRENGLADEIRFPIEEDGVDSILVGLGKRKTAEEQRIADFEEALSGALDAYGHMTWTVGNEDWQACGDFALGILDGRRFLAWHVVVDCESGGFTDTLEKGFVEITAGSNPPLGILHQWLDTAFEHYAHEQDGGKDPEKEHLQIDAADCARIANEFDDEIRRIWAGGGSPEITWPDDEEQEEPFDPVAWGWVGGDGRP